MEIKVSSALCATFLCFGFQCFHGSESNGGNTVEAMGNLPSANNDGNPCLASDSFYTKIRDGHIKLSEAGAELNSLILPVSNYYYSHGGKDYKRTAWIFPVQGYTASAIGGKEGSGYMDKDYRYFDGNLHKGHPAHDIFIHDKNQDGLDDATGKPVYILSVSGGIVFAYEPHWDTLSNLRGGKYLWIYDPAEKAFFYYAHNDSLLVGPGDIVKPGDKIAIMGRSGTNAFKKRSPTHLHFSFLMFRDSIPRPVNIYHDLLKAKFL